MQDPVLEPTDQADVDAAFMRVALAEADRAAERGEVPVGAVLVGKDGTVLATGFNLRETDADPTAHAEIVAIRAASRARGSWRLDDTTLYVTLEPCPMCAGAMVNARLGRLVYGCDDPKAGACTSLFTIGQDTRLNHRFPMTRGVLETDCADRLKRFFAALRAQGKK
ncbi:tRNA-specific adenosine-34 deaminase [Labilithrix luteola]|uniref:tRNA-specific adenosine deaminase n=1 Tax=Labilithrix luteola TaxID=1391654 RepID=A0A0K1PVP9_9BACT|nr:tRNA-specific adenosine-34 deaminase [Labilithrix luteola]